MLEENKTVDLKEEDLEKVTGGTYDPNTGKGLAVGDFLSNTKDNRFFYKITNVNTSYYNVETYITKKIKEANYIFMQISFNAIVRGEFIPCSTPDNIHTVTLDDYWV